MDMSKKLTCNDKKMVLKKGTGGVGTVILFGGALATATLASVFIVGLKKRRSSAVKRCDEPAKKSEANEQEVHEFVYVDEVSSAAVSKEVESNSALLGDAQNLELDEKTDINNDGSNVEQSGDGEMKVIDHEETVEGTEAENRTEENVEVCSDQEESGLTAVDKTLEDIDNDKMEAKDSEMKTDMESESNGETEEVQIEGAEKTKLDLVANTETDQYEGETTKVDGVVRVNVDPMELEANPSKEVNYDDEGPSVIESPVMEHRNAEFNVKDEVLPTDMVDMSVGVISENQEITKNNDVTEGVTGVIEEQAEEKIQEDEVSEGVREDEVKYVVEEELLEEQKEIDQFDEKIPCEITEQVKEELSNNEHEKSEEVDEEIYNNENEPENQELQDCERNVEKLPILEKQMISLESNDCEANEEVPENNLLEETTRKEVEDKSRTINIAEKNIVNEADLSATTDTDTEKTSIDLIMETNEIEKGETEIIVDYDEMDLSDEVEESSVGTGESSTDSNSEAVWPTEESLETQQVNLINQELDGKALEDKKPNAENDLHVREVKLEKESQRAPIMVKDRPENAMKNVMLIVILSVFSSYSCSWLFGCSFVKLSLIMFFSIVLSKIYGH